MTTTASLEDRLIREGLALSSWSNGPGVAYGVHDHPYDKVIVVGTGSIRSGLPAADRSVDLAAGDRLELPAGTAHDAVVGPDGVRCLEGHRPAGALHAIEHREAGSW
jgi:quercetin dioxygenase-like cupin family protein